MLSMQRNKLMQSHQQSIKWDAAQVHFNKCSIEIFMTLVFCNAMSKKRKKDFKGLYAHDFYGRKTDSIYCEVLAATKCVPAQGKGHSLFLPQYLSGKFSSDTYLNMDLS
jgi:hypothetical protein